MRKRNVWLAVLGAACLAPAASASSGPFQLTGAVSKNPGTNPIYSVTDANNLLNGSIPNNGILHGTSSSVNFYYSLPSPNEINPYGSHFTSSWSAFPFTPSVQASFAMSAQGTVVIPKDGTYDFGVNSDDGFSLQVGSLNISYANGRSAGDTIGSAYFTAGSYPLDLTYFQTDGNAVVELYAGLQQGSVPYSSFSSAPAGTFQLVGGSGTGALQLAATAVPEPAAVGLLALGIGAMLVRRRRLA